MALQKAYIGCQPEAQYTYDDGCFLRAFATVPAWQALYRAVARCAAVASSPLPVAARLRPMIGTVCMEAR
jgi:hypothetical protein